jgi:hypothetical protein
MGIDSEPSLARNWPEIEVLFGGFEAIDDLARATGALSRRRLVRDGSQLLRLALNYATAGGSLRTTAGWSEFSLGVAFSDVALLRRLRESGDFLASLATVLLARLARDAAPSGAWSGPPIRLVDGSLFIGPGRKGGRLRMHASYDPARQMFTAFDVTDIKRGESLSLAGIEPGDIAVADRNYAKTHALRRLSEIEAFFAVRAGIRSTRMLDSRDGERLGAAGVLAALGEAGEAELEVGLIEAKLKKGSHLEPVQARLVILRAGDAFAAHENARIERSRRTHKATPTEDTLALAGVVMILTNLPADAWPIRRIADLYRLRWQIELAFKTLKSTFVMRDVPAKDPRLARSWILANLAAALLAEILSSAIERAIPPSEDKPAAA